MMMKGQIIFVVLLLHGLTASGQESDTTDSPTEVVTDGNPAAVTDGRTIAATEEAPVATEEAPVATEEAPVVTEEAPVVTEEAPVATEEAPVATEEAPVATEEALVATEEALVATEEAPVVTEEAPVVTEEAPVVTEEAPVATEEAPVATEEAPVVTDAPTDSTMTGTPDETPTGDPVASTEAPQATTDTVTDESSDTKAQPVTNPPNTAIPDIASSIPATTPSVVSISTSTASSPVNPTTPTVSVISNLVCGQNASSLPPVCHPDNHTHIVRSSGSRQTDDSNIPVGEWLRFTDSNEECLQITMFDTTDACYKPGSCGSSFPYYMVGSGTPGKGQELGYNICTTEVTVAGDRYKCCHYTLPIYAYNCGNFLLYKLGKQMSRDLRGRFCTINHGESPNLIYTVSDDAEAPYRINKLTPEQRENLLTVILNVHNSNDYKNKYSTSTRLELALKDKIVSAFNSDSRRKRSAPPNDYDVEIVEGSPVYNDDEDKLQYVIFVHDGKNSVIPKKVVEEKLQKLAGSDLADDGGVTIKGTSLILPEPVKRSLTIKQAQKSDAGQRLWIVILIIVGVTAFIIAACFMAVLCYQVSRRCHNKTVNISQKHALIHADEEAAPSMYVAMNGHDNQAMDPEEQDDNANSKNTEALDADKSMEPFTAEASL